MPHYLRLIGLSAWLLACPFAAIAVEDIDDGDVQDIDAGVETESDRIIANARASEQAQAQNEAALRAQQAEQQARYGYYNSPYYGSPYYGYPYGYYGYYDQPDRRELAGRGMAGPVGGGGGGRR
jgi:hypothetical protein